MFPHQGGGVVSHINIFFRQENVFKSRGFRYAGSHTLIQSIIFFSIAQLRHVYRLKTNQLTDRNILPVYSLYFLPFHPFFFFSFFSRFQILLIQIGLFSMFGIVTETYSVNYLNYPTYVLLMMASMKRQF